MEHDKFKNRVIIASTALALIALCLFVKAIFMGKQPSMEQTETVEVKVFLNENDSIINQLQKDVSSLTRIIQALQSDTLVVSRAHTSTSLSVE